MKIAIAALLILFLLVGGYELFEAKLIVFDLRIVDWTAIGALATAVSAVFTAWAAWAATKASRAANNAVAATLQVDRNAARRAKQEQKNRADCLVQPVHDQFAMCHADAISAAEAIRKSKADGARETIAVCSRMALRRHSLIDKFMNDFALFGPQDGPILFDAAGAIVNISEQIAMLGRATEPNRQTMGFFEASTDFTLAELEEVENKCLAAAQLLERMGALQWPRPQPPAG